MVISPIENTFFGISSEGNPKDVECVLSKDLIDHERSFPGAKWRVPKAMPASEAERASQIYTTRFISMRGINGQTQIQSFVSDMVAFIKFDGTPCDENKSNQSYVVLASANTFICEQGYSLYGKTFPVVKMIYDKSRNKLLEQKGILTFSERGAHLSFYPADGMHDGIPLWHFLRLKNLGGIIAIA